MPSEPPQVIVIKKGDDHGCIITLLLAIIAWPLAVLYLVIRAVKWVIGTGIDWLTLGPLRRRRRPRY